MVIILLRLYSFPERSCQRQHNLSFPLVRPGGFTEENRGSDSRPKIGGDIEGCNLNFKISLIQEFFRDNQ